MSRHRSKPGCRTVESVTVLWLTTEADNQNSVHCAVISVGVIVWPYIWHRDRGANPAQDHYTSPPLFLSPPLPSVPLLYLPLPPLPLHFMPQSGPPNLARGFEGAVWAPPAEFGAELRPQKHSVYILCPEIVSGTGCNYFRSFLC